MLPFTKSCGRIIAFKTGLHAAEPGTEGRSWPGAITRAALLSLFAFFEGVLNQQVKTVIQERREFAGVERQDTLKKCDAMVEYCFSALYQAAQTFCSLYGYQPL